MDEKEIYNKIKKYLDEDDNFESLSQFRSSLFEIIDEPITKKKSDILFYRILQICNFRNFGSLNKNIFILIIDMFYNDNSDLKQLVYNQLKINTKYYGIEGDEIAELLASGFLNHPIQNKGYDISSCLCSHSHIVYHYIVENDIEERCWLGSKCIENFMIPYNYTMADTLKELKLKVKHKKEGHLCYYCKNPLGNLRENYCKKKCCSNKCLKKLYYKIPFGKYKGQYLTTLKDTKYIDWCKDKYMNEDSFKNYETFIEIIFEKF